MLIAVRSPRPRLWSSGGNLGVARIGEAAHPGPHDEKPVRSIEVATINVTALMPSLALVASLGSNIIAIQEHSVHADRIEAAK
eukprot:15453221-Alexandrium_andersonii.AAC.1